MSYNGYNRQLFQMGLIPSRALWDSEILDF